MIVVNRMRKTDVGGNVKAFFDATINGVAVNGLKLVTSTTAGNMFLSFPREKGKDEKYYNIVDIQDINLKAELEKVLLETYKNIKDDRVPPETTI